MKAEGGRDGGDVNIENLAFVLESVEGFEWQMAKIYLNALIQIKFRKVSGKRTDLSLNQSKPSARHIQFLSVK